MVGYEDGTINVIDLKSCSVTSRIPSNLGHSAAITALDCHLDNNLILSAAMDGKTIVSAANTGRVCQALKCVEPIGTLREQLFAAAVSSNFTEDQ